MTTERRCEDFCGAMPGPRRAHTNECCDSPAPCFGRRDGMDRRVDGTPCCCSPECRDAGLRYWDGRDAIERLAAKTALGEPLVVSGTDAGPASSVCTYPPPWRVCLHCRCQTNAKVRVCCAPGQADDLGTVPAPVETPPTEWPCADCGANVDKGGRSAPRPICDACWNKAAPAETPAPPGPGPCEVRECYGQLVAVVDGHALCESHRLGRGKDDPVPPAFLGSAPPEPFKIPSPQECPACAKVARHPGEGYACAWHTCMYCGRHGNGTVRECCDKGLAADLAQAAAPAPGVGEGPRELAFAEAYPQYLAKPGSVECQDGDGCWTEFKPVFPWTPETVLMVLGWSYRLKPPAPAPKPGRVAEMARSAYEEWVKSSDRMPMLGSFGADVVDAHQEEIRRRLISYRRSNEATDDIDDLLARARVAMLGAEAGK